MKGRAHCHGAVTIVNGIATGNGAAFGIDLTTKAVVELNDDFENFKVLIEGDETENPALAIYCVQKVLQSKGLEKKYGATISTISDIPISRGLKSSSAAANAVVLATFDALGIEYTDTEVINFGIDSSLKAKVSLTGAFDDAAATYFGNVVVTNNLKREILLQYKIEEDYIVIIHVPLKKIKKMDIDVSRLKLFKPEFEKAHKLALEKNYKSGLFINGLAYGKAMGLDTSIAQSAIDAGAVTAGITGTGPATVILAEPEKKDDIIAGIHTKDRIIISRLNRDKADIGVLNKY